MTLAVEEPTAVESALVEAMEALEGPEPRTLQTITGNGVSIAKQYGTGVGHFWYVIVSDIATDLDWAELDDLSEELGVHWQSRVLWSHFAPVPCPALPGSTSSTIYTVHPEARS
ncbi:hypothetical protein H9W91_07195 [Streptomyces alfalfae]|uniref:hypothetical protein n=1 Tax=Streptomyces alfalfae TaxID=1642299 RepID=UPI001BA662EC|nr:hypothetical protein [Streptomyces alfalfae]QUI30670.1 hypothetical protein H9W91_07195 [Streptomyces alfalfae]